ncbi:MAG: site-2 protease family protein [Anaerolineales bacterium]|nr:site-2 protease family protein [Anaerolineales bacterium]
MVKSFPLVKVFGIEIRVDLTWAFAFGVILWSLGTYYFPNEYDTMSVLDAWTLALAVTVFLYFSIVAHELGHSLVSKKLGVDVKVITLFIVGGLAHLEQEPDKARNELAIALTGPLVSLGLALLFGVLVLAGEANVGVKLVAFGRWLALANLSLALFNLLPGFPLDGGRALRAVIWSLTGSFERATKVAGFMGQAVAFGLMSWGGLQIFDGHIANGFWVVLIGWFLYRASIQSMANAALKSGLADLTVREIIRSNGHVVPPTMSLEQLLREVALPTGEKWFPVSGGGKIIGVITLEEVQSIDRVRRGSTTVGQTMKMIHELPAISPDEGVYKAFERMVKENLSLLQVAEDGIWLGSVTKERILTTWSVQSSLQPLKGKMQKR